MAAKTYYEILEVAPTATAKDIHKAYRRMNKMNHPDNLESLTHLSPAFKALAEERTKEINAAYDILKDQQKRAKYDNLLADQRQAEENHRQAEEAKRRQEEERQQRENQQQAEEEQRRREAQAAAEQSRRQKESRRQDDVRVDPPKPPKTTATKWSKLVVMLVVVILGVVGMSIYYSISTPDSISTPVSDSTSSSIPDLRGLSLAEGVEEAARKDLKVQVFGVGQSKQHGWESQQAKGTIILQNPSPRRSSEPEDNIIKVMIQGEGGAIPDVRGLSGSQACKAIMDFGAPAELNGAKCTLDVDRSGEIVSTADGLRVIGTDPPAGTRVTAGFTVKMTTE